MRILWSIHLYPPTHNCGAEYVAHHVNKFLLSQGHEVRVMILQNCDKPYVYDGVEVVPYPRYGILDAYMWADAVFTHLDYDRHTMNICNIIKRPVFHFMHNDAVDYYRYIDESKVPQYLVYNSEWIKKAYSFKHTSTVLYPPCPADFYRILGSPWNSEYITLINTNENKGGYIFARIAEAMPDKKFLAVNGSYDDGGIMPEINAKLESLPNVKFVQHSSNVREIYQQTKILLVLSRYESWGRVATEAMSNGIPIIYCPTSGLDENIKGAGLRLSKRGERITDKQTNEIISHDGNSYDISEAIDFIEELCIDADLYRELQIEGLSRYQELAKFEKTQLYGLQQLMQQAKQNNQNNYHISANNSTTAKFGRN